MDSISYGGTTNLWSNLTKLKERTENIQLAFLLDWVEGVETMIEDLAVVANSLLLKFCPLLSANDQQILDPISQTFNQALLSMTNISFTLITLEELTGHLKTHCSKAAQGLDGFPMIALKKIWDIIRPHLLLLINCSLACSHLPRH